MDSLIETTTLLSQRGSLYSEEGSERRTGTTRFDRSKRRAYYEKPSVKRKRKAAAARKKRRRALARSRDWDRD